MTSRGGRLREEICDPMTATSTTLPIPQAEPALPAGEPGLTVYEDLRARGNAAVLGGRFDEALPLFEQALSWVQQHGDPVLEDRAFVNWSAVKISLGRGDEALAGLRRVLMRNLDPRNCRLAAYNIARIYEHKRDAKKGLFYAQVARGFLAQLGTAEPEWLASDHNQYGNFLVAESRFGEAEREYRKALAADPEAAPLRFALVEQNLGYCYLMLRRLGDALPLLYRSLRAVRGVGDRQQEAAVRLDLALGLLEIERYRPALRHSRRALDLVDGSSEELLKNALYLCGETALHVDGPEAAHDYFGRLQELFPDSAFVAELLMAVDVRQMINLRA